MPIDSGQWSRSLLHALLDVSREGIADWSPEDHRSILEHQIASPLGADADRLAEIGRCSRAEVERIIATSGCRTFGDVVRTRPPCAAALRLVKEYGKAVLGGEGDLPRDVGRVLYVLAIVHGRRTGVQHITSLDHATVEREVRHCLTFGWLPDPIRKLLRSE